MAIYVLSDHGESELRAVIRQIAKPTLADDAFLTEAEQEFTDATDMGNDPVLELGAAYCADGIPQTIGLMSDWFEAAVEYSA